MSLTATVIAIAALDLAVILALVYVMRIPFRIDRQRQQTFTPTLERRPVEQDLRRAA
jgi:hypothetical protein